MSKTASSVFWNIYFSNFSYLLIKIPRRSRCLEARLTWALLPYSVQASHLTGNISTRLQFPFKNLLGFFSFVSVENPWENITKPLAWNIKETWQYRIDVGVRTTMQALENNPIISNAEVGTIPEALKHKKTSK